MKKQKITFTDPETKKTVNVTLRIGDFWVDVEIEPESDEPCSGRIEFYDGQFSLHGWNQGDDYYGNDPQTIVLGKPKDES